MFKKYKSIENAYRDDVLDRIKGHGFWEQEYVVQEKVHGANLSFWTTDGENFFAGKRTAQLGEKESFHNFQSILGKLTPKLKNIWKTLNNSRVNLQQVTVFGELIGGDYPLLDVAVDREAIMVQKQISYSPSNEFFAFDIMINSEEYLGVEECNELFEQEKMLFAETLLKGKIEDCLAYPNEFNSLVPEKLGLPPLEINTVEGTIIRPLKSLFFNNDVRVILKNKNDKWAENTRFNRLVRKEELSDEIKFLKEAICTYATENRLLNVVSKMGEVTPKDFGIILGQFNRDVINDFKKDYKEDLQYLDKEGLKAVKKAFHSITIQLINDYFKR